MHGQVLCCSSNQVLIFILSWYTMHRLSYKRYPLSYPYPPYERLAQCQFVVHGLIKKLFSAPIHMKRIDHLFICTQTFFRCLFCFVLFRFLTYVENIGLSRTAVCTFYVCLFVFMIRGYSHVRLGGDALYSTPKNCHSETDEESGTTSIPAPFSWECAPPPRPGGILCGHYVHQSD